MRSERPHGTADDRPAHIGPLAADCSQRTVRALNGAHRSTVAVAFTALVCRGWGGILVVCGRARLVAAQNEIERLVPHRSVVDAFRLQQHARAISLTFSHLFHMRRGTHIYDGAARLIPACISGPVHDDPVTCSGILVNI